MICVARVPEPRLARRLRAAAKRPASSPRPTRRRSARLSSPLRAYAAEVVALRADDLRRPADVLADVVVAGRREHVERVEEHRQSGHIVRRRRREPLAQLRQQVAARRRSTVSDVVHVKWFAPAACSSMSSRGRSSSVRDQRDRLGDAVAQPDAPHVRVAVHRQADAVLRVRVVEQQRVRRQPLDVLRDRPPSAARSAACATGRPGPPFSLSTLGKPCFSASSWSVFHVAVAVDRDRRDDEVGARQRLVALGRACGA